MLVSWQVAISSVLTFDVCLLFSPKTNDGEWGLGGNNHLLKEQCDENKDIKGGYYNSYGWFREVV